MKKQIVNIVNFVRGCDPRHDMDLYTPVAEQVKLLNEYSLPGTFLLMYDALCDDRFADILKNRNCMTECGVWLEIVQSQCDKAGVKWRGREGYPWDFHANAGFTVAYKPQERERLVDVLFEKFREIYGDYPRSVGSWAIDAYTYDYISGKYDVDASCNCKDQWGTDGYTLWGGYYNQAYYPCKNNMFCPAQTAKEQIVLPIFRMLGSDPIYQYDFGLDENGDPAKLQGVATLEPVYCGTDGGGVPDWVDWYFNENFSGRCVSFGYTQAGQENSFGWESMRDGLIYQFKKIDELTKAGKVEALTLSETGAWFRKTFASTPPSVVSAMSDRHGMNRRSVWFDCKNYRANVFTELDNFWIRDIFLFREGYRERYLDTVNDSKSMTFDNLPFTDGNRCSGNGVRAGLYPFADGEKLVYSDVVYSENENSATVSFSGTQVGEFSVSMFEDRIEFSAQKDFCLENITKKGEDEPQKRVDGDGILLNYRGFEYRVGLIKGVAENADLIRSENGRIVLLMK